MKMVTVRGLEPRVVEALKRAAQERSVSMNRFIVEALQDAVHLGRGGMPVHHDLDEFFGTWDEEECRQVQEAVERGRTIDEELWS